VSEQKDDGRNKDERDGTRMTATAMAQRQQPKTKARKGGDNDRCQGKDDSDCTKATSNQVDLNGSG